MGTSGTFSSSTLETKLRPVSFFIVAAFEPTLIAAICSSWMAVMTVGSRTGLIAVKIAVQQAHLMAVN